jgi:hypothetical protein
MIDPAEARLVFVAGLHRSGTTALARLLGQHPDVSALSATGVKEDEGQHLQHVYDRARLHGGPGRFAFSPRAHLTEDSELATPASAVSMLASWEPYWDTSRPVLLEKSPPNLLMTRFLQKLFPNASFVVITRHPVVVALSTSKWVRFGRLDTSVEHWLTAHETFAADRVHLDRVHVLKYEDVVGDPAGQLAQVADFLGLTGSLPLDGWRQDRSRTYEDRWAQMGRRPLARQVRRRIVERFGDRIARFAYDAETLRPTDG